MRERLLSFAQRFNPEAELEPKTRVYPHMSRCIVQVGDGFTINLSASSKHSVTEITADAYQGAQLLIGVWGLRSDDLLEKILRTAIDNSTEKEETP